VGELQEAGSAQSCVLSILVLLPCWGGGRVWIQRLEEDIDHGYFWEIPVDKRRYD
jgi:hypothetical protein